MKILLISATHREIDPVVKTLENLICLKEGFLRGFAGSRMVDILITGVGASAVSETLARHLAFSKYDLVLNLGICGSFNKKYALKQVVNIVSEVWGDLGAEDKDEFLDLFDLGMRIPGEMKFTGTSLLVTKSSFSHYFSHLPEVKGITVNKAHGNKESITRCVLKFQPDVETMEGAAVFQVCLSMGINFQCLRSISNFVEPRNRTAWDIGGAIANLSIEVNKILFEINK